MFVSETVICCFLVNGMVVAVAVVVVDEDNCVVLHLVDASFLTSLYLLAFFCLVYHRV